MEILYNAITKVFDDNVQYFTDRELQPIRQIDIDYGQSLAPDNWEIFYPALFVSFAQAPGNNPDYLNDMTITFKLLCNPVGGSENFSETTSLNFLKTIEAVKYMLNYLETEWSTQLQYAGEQTDNSEYYITHTLTYNCVVKAYNNSVHKTNNELIQINNLQIDL